MHPDPASTALAFPADAGKTRAVVLAGTLEEAKRQRDLLTQFVHQAMVEEVDYGKIPGTDRYALLKPGADKLVAWYHCTPEYTIERDVQDFEKGFFMYRFSVQLRQRDINDVVAVGWGTANSKESKHRYRNAARKCPDCGKETIRQSRGDRAGESAGFYCWAKIGGCGKRYAADEKRITEQPMGKVENPDPADVDNTVLKMAKKRALVDAALALGQVAELFHKDEEEDDEEPAIAKKGGKAEARAEAIGPSLFDRTKAGAEAKGTTKTARFLAVKQKAHEQGMDFIGWQSWTAAILGHNVTEVGGLTENELQKLEQAATFVEEPEPPRVA